MGFFDNFFEKKYDKPIAGKPTISRAIAGGAQNQYGALSRNSRWENLDTSVNMAYNRVVWVFRAVHAIASSQASLDINLRDMKDEQGRVIEDKNLWRLLNRQANPFEDAWTFRYRLSSQLLLSSKGAFIEIVREGGNFGEPKEIYLLDPDKVEAVPDERRWIKHYKVQRANGLVETIPVDNVLYVRNLPDPQNPYRNIIPLDSATTAIYTDIYGRLFNKNYLQKDGRPGLLIGINGELDPDVAEELNFMLNNSQGETRILEVDGLTSVDLGSKPRDAQWQEALESAKENILSAFGVPESVLGNASGRCLRASELVHLADGTTRTAQSLVGQTFTLWQPGHNGLKKVTAKAEYAKSEKIYRIKTFSGRTLETNGEHPLFMGASVGQGLKGVWKKDFRVNGWTGMAKIKDHFDRNDRVKAGTYTEVAVPTMFTQDGVVLGDPDQARKDAEGLRTVPDYIFNADQDTQKAFLSSLYSSHGKVSQHTGFDIYVPTQEYAQRLQRLLLRFGVYGNVVIKKQQHAVEILTKPNILTFLYQVQLSGKAAENAANVQKRLTTKSDFTIHSLRNDGLPAGMMWDRVLEVEEIGTDQTVAITIHNSTERHYLGLFWEHNTYSNAEAEAETFWENTMRTHCKAISRQLDRLTESTSDTIYLEYDYSSVDILQRAERRKLDRHRQDFNNGAITVNDYRAKLGLDPLPKELAFYGESYFHASRAVAAKPEHVELIRQMPVIGQQQEVNPFGVTSPTGGDGVVGGFNDQVQGELAQTGSDAAQTTNDQAARTLRSSNGRGLPAEAVNPRASSEIHDRVNTLINRKVDRDNTEVKSVQADPHRDLRNRMQGFIEGSLETWSNRQLNVVGDRLTHTKVRKGTRHWQGETGTKDLDVNYVLDTKEWTDDISNSIRKVMRDTLMKESQIRINDLSDSGVKIQPVTSNDVDGILESVYSWFTKSVEQQSQLVQKHVHILDTEGKSIEEIQETLQPENFDRNNWTVLLAKRVTTNAIEQLTHLISGRIGGKVSKTWKTANNEMFRDSHAALNNLTLPYNEQFEVGSVKMSFPTAIIGDEGDNCTCWVFHTVEKE